MLPGYTDSSQQHSCSGSEDESPGGRDAVPAVQGTRSGAPPAPEPSARSARQCRELRRSVSPALCPLPRERCPRPDSRKLLTSLASPLRLCGPARRQRVPAAPLTPAPAGRVSFGREDVAQKEPRRSQGIPGPRRSPSCGHAGTPGPCPGPGGGSAQSLRSAPGRHSKYPSKTSSSLSVS